MHGSNRPALFLCELQIHKLFKLIEMRDVFMRARRWRKVDLGCSPSVGVLVEAKRVALRRHVWFRALSLVERGIVDLTVQCVDIIKSGKLAKLLTAIMGKLKSAMESTVERLVRTIGFPLAEKISCVAVNWGNVSAESWASDASFAAFLVRMHISNGFGQR